MLGRRDFLGLTAIAGTAAGDLAPAATRDASAAELTFRRRVAAAAAQRSAFRSSVGNGDAQRFAVSGPVVTYAKGFPRGGDGRVDRQRYASYSRAIDRRDVSILDQSIVGINRLLLAYALGDECVIAGRDPRGIHLEPAPSITSAEQAHEAIELAWLALVRDVPFARYDTDSLVAAAASELGYAPETILQPRNAAITGPIVSQLALRDIPMAPFADLPQRLTSYAAGTEFLVARDEWLLVQSGGRTGKRHAYDARPRYLSNARDLAGWVSVEPFTNAAAIIDSLPDEAHARSWLPQAQTGLLGLGAACAGVGTMFQKLVVHRRLRPEEFFGFIDAPDPGLRLHDAIGASSVFRRLQERFGSKLLPQAYPGGAPSYAAYPAGHAVGAGIAATMLKANVRPDYVMTDPVVANADGSALVAYTGPPLTLGNEIDKLAFNYAYGRHAAGVHYRSDSDRGLRFGEAIALAVLRDVDRLAGTRSFGYRLRTFDGDTVTIGKPI